MAAKGKAAGDVGKWEKYSPVPAPAWTAGQEAKSEALLKWARTTYPEDAASLEFISKAATYRYLVTYDWSVDKAASKLKEVVLWRRANVLPTASCPVCKPGVVGDRHCIVCPSLDRFGRPIIYMNLQRLLDKTPKAVVAHLAAVNEDVFDPADGGQMLFIMDARGVSLLGSGMGKEMAVEFVTTFTMCYPERMGTLVLLEPPTVLEWLMAAIKPFMDASTARKIMTVRMKDAESLLNWAVGAHDREALQWLLAVANSDPKAMPGVPPMPSGPAARAHWRARRKVRAAAEATGAEGPHPHAHAHPHLHTLTAAASSASSSSLGLGGGGGSDGGSDGTTLSVPSGSPGEARATAPPPAPAPGASPSQPPPSSSSSSSSSTLSAALATAAGGATEGSLGGALEGVAAPTSSGGSSSGGAGGAGQAQGGQEGEERRPVASPTHSVAAAHAAIMVPEQRGSAPATPAAALPSATAAEAVREAPAAAPAAPPGPGALLASGSGGGASSAPAAAAAAVTAAPATPQAAAATLPGSGGPTGRGAPLLGALILGAPVLGTPILGTAAVLGAPAPPAPATSAPNKAAPSTPAVAAAAGGGGPVTPATASATPGPRSLATSRSLPDPAPAPGAPSLGAPAPLSLSLVLNSGSLGGAAAEAASSAPRRRPRSVTGPHHFTRQCVTVRVPGIGNSPDTSSPSPPGKAPGSGPNGPARTRSPSRDLPLRRGGGGSGIPVFLHEPRAQWEAYRTAIDELMVNALWSPTLPRKLLPAAGTLGATPGPAEGGEEGGAGAGARAAGAAAGGGVAPALGSPAFPSSLRSAAPPGSGSSGTGPLRRGVSAPSPASAPASHGQAPFGAAAAGPQAAADGGGGSGGLLAAISNSLHMSPRRLRYGNS